MQKLADWLAREFPHAKKQTLKRMVEGGRVTVNGRRAARLTQSVEANDVVRVHPRATEAESKSSASLHPIVLVYEDEDVLVIDKPAGLLTSTGPREKRPTALAIVRAYVTAREPRARVGLIHRLDRDASGLLMFSKSHLAYDSLKTQFFKHSVDRVYEATVHGVPSPPKGMIDTRLVERADGSVRSTDEHAKGQRAVTEYELIEKSRGPLRGQSRVRVKLRTGRKHQIRVHLSERGWPIVGDAVYGKPRETGALMLRAVRLVIAHPRTGKRMTFDAPAR